MPAPVDHDTRRVELAEGVWSILHRDGFAGLTLRKLAAQMGGTTGLITHYFASKDELVEFALELLHVHTDSRAVAQAPEGSDALTKLRARLLSVLPLDDESVRLNRIWISYWGVALADPNRSRGEAARYDAWRERLRPLVSQAMAEGKIRPAPERLLLDLICAATHGLAVQAVLDPDRLPPKVLHGEIDLLLDMLG
ncbi:TetR/AcrR family transcriptional regulator [Asanoa siamensis]|uniref:TetR family transcriptional regulator n=1 Tax=Asanoa siamensis TaxID=926357 RepID=A0ABQ4D2S5_9ACTN|nr:TetR family transcriptional regulator C-terminal domain-containing protein [Asanoa siamensis]GIF77834.1 TetR family transcriptional regulator [Asanoa siamensis]